MNGRIRCNHNGCGHESDSQGLNLEHGSLHFTASVMGNPEYLVAIKNIEQAPDERMGGIERLNAYHASEHEKRIVRELPAWSRSK